MLGYFYIGILCVVWGSTYLAIRIGISDHSGFGVFSFGYFRCFIAAAVLFLLARAQSRPVFPTKREIVHLAVTGLAMWIGAHGMVLWSEQYIHSGIAAVMAGTIPLWVLLFESAAKRLFPKVSTFMFLLLGFAGVGVLMFPVIQTSDIHHMTAFVCLIIAPICWSLSSVLIKRNPINLPVFYVSAYQHVFGGIGFLILALAAKEPWPAPTGEAMTALLFLVIFGSVVAFTAYIKVLSLLPTEIVTTYTYVNPIIAVFLGWMFLGEPITLWTTVATVFVVTSIAGTITLRARA